MIDRLRAFLIHFCLSLAIIGGLIAAVLWLWYPSPLFAYEGALGVVKIVVLVDVIIGPVLTFVVFKRGKRGLIIDLAAILILQLAAFSYGAYALWSQRPQAIAFAGDAFYVVGAGEIAGKPWPQAMQERRPAFGPLIVFAEPTGSIDHTMAVLEGTAADIHAMPEQYRPVAAHLDRIAGRSGDLATLATRYQSVKQVLSEIPADWLKSAIAVPMHGRHASGTLFVDRRTGEIVGHHDFDLSAVLLLEQRRLLEKNDSESEQSGVSTSP